MLRTRWRAAGVFVALAVLAAYFGLRGRQSSFSAAVPPLASRPLTLTSGIHLLGGLSPAAAYVVETSKGLVLVDSGLEPDAGPLRSQLLQLGLDWKRVRAILLTHAHGDHCGGAEFLRKAAGAKVHAGQADAAVIRAGGPREAVFSTFYMPVDSRHPTAVDVELKGGELLDFGDVRVRAIATPGHTPGSICYLLERPGLRALFAGDIIMKLRGDDPPGDEFSKPLGTYAAYLAPRYRGDAGDLAASLRTLRALPVPDLVLPGHPSADPAPQSPCLTQQRWESLLDTGIHDMEQLLSRFQADGRSFLDGSPKRLLPDLYYLGDFQGRAVYALIAATKLFLVNAPGGSGLDAFVTDRLRQLGLTPRPPAAVLLTSCDAAETGGLDELVAKHHPTVVAAPAGLPALAGSGRKLGVFLSADQLPGKGWFPVSPILLDGRGEGPIAYRFPWSGKTVLCTGRIPIKIDQEAGVALFADFQNGNGDVTGYLESLARLASVKPDLWLPAVPTNGQNANLYDTDWTRLLDDNRTGILRNRGALNRPVR